MVREVAAAAAGRCRIPEADMITAVAPAFSFILPTFWLLVPGAAGLIGVTQIVGSGQGTASRGLSDALLTIMSISLGVLTGAAAYRAAQAGARRLSPALSGADDLTPQG
jgi:uncharacterized membrane protein YjjB (DUF3815 family)